MNQILGDLDDSLFRLRQIRRNRNTQELLGINKPEETISRIRNSSRSAKNLIPLKTSVDTPMNNIDINRPMNDMPCMQNYPINCVSKNWEIIRCHILLYPLSSSANNIDPSITISSQNYSRKSPSCTNFKVKLEHIT